MRGTAGILLRVLHSCPCVFQELHQGLCTLFLALGTKTEVLISIHSNASHLKDLGCNLDAQVFIVALLCDVLISQEEPLCISSLQCLRWCSCVEWFCLLPLLHHSEFRIRKALLLPESDRGARSWNELLIVLMVFSRFCQLRNCALGN